MIVLTGSQVGSGYKLEAYPFGNSIIGEATLDLCGASYPSEILRTGRLQVRYAHSGKSLTVSNEVVTYVPGGAKEALKEVTEVANACAKKPAVLKQAGVTETYKVSLLKDARVPAGAIAVRIEIEVSKGKKHTTQTGVAVYQVKGNTLSGLYTFVDEGNDVRRRGAGRVPRGRAERPEPRREAAQEGHRQRRLHRLSNFPRPVEFPVKRLATPSRRRRRTRAARRSATSSGRSTRCGSR